MTNLKYFLVEIAEMFLHVWKWLQNPKKRTKKEKRYKKLIQLKIVTKYVDLKNKNRPFFQTYEWKND